MNHIDHSGTTGPSHGAVGLTLHGSGSRPALGNENECLAPLGPHTSQPATRPHVGGDFFSTGRADALPTTPDTVHFTNPWHSHHSLHADAHHILTSGGSSLADSVPFNDRFMAEDKSVHFLPHSCMKDVHFRPKSESPSG